MASCTAGSPHSEGTASPKSCGRTSVSGREGENGGAAGEVEVGALPRGWR